MVLLSLLAACGGSAPAPAAPAPLDGAWVKGVQPWYCGAEPSEATQAADGAAGKRDIAMKLRPTEDSISGLYGRWSAGRPQVGTLTRFVSTGDRTGTLAWENDDKGKGVATLAFSPDFRTLTVTWQVDAGDKPAPTTVTAAADVSTCAAAPLIR